MKQGMLYGVGVGPGDPELITLKAIRLLRAADVIAVPDKGGGERTALEIVRAHVGDTPLLRCLTPMVRDPERLDRCYEEIAERLILLLDQGKTVAFLTLGDPTVYSTYAYVHRKVVARGYPAEMIPGVPSFCAAAARLGESLCQGTERLLVVPASHAVEDTLNYPANLVFMKGGRALPALKERLAEQGMLGRAMVVANCGMENERVCPMADLEDGPGYFAVVLVKQKECVQ